VSLKSATPFSVGICVRTGIRVLLNKIIEQVAVRENGSDYGYLPKKRDLVATDL
jgi:hypothetical protein